MTSGGHLATRNAGFVACLAGALAMISGRYAAGAPSWLIYVGVSVIVFGWGLFLLSMVRRAADARARMRTPEVKS
jgi:hypothetical protein